MKNLRNLYSKLRPGSLVMNASYLMASTLVVAAAGFVFWVVVAKRYSTSEVGLATTLLSVTSLLSLLGLAGFDTTFVRLLPGSQRKNDYINSGFIIVTLLTSVLSLAIAVAMPVFIPSLGLMRSGWAVASFVFFTVATALNVLTNAIFLAYKRAMFILIINSLFSGLRIILPLVVAGGGALVIFNLAGLAQLAGLVLSLGWMRRNFGWRFGLVLDRSALRAARRFAASVYASSVLNLLPPTILPLIVVRFLGASQAAYYYMAFTIAGVLYTVAYSLMQSAFAESSHDESGLRSHMLRAAKLSALVLVPASLVIVVVAHLILGVFGRHYAEGADNLLRIFALASLPVACYSGLGAIFKVTKHLRGVVFMNVAYSLCIILLSLWLVPRAGLASVGWVWLIGNLTACAVGVWFLINKDGRHNGEITSAGRGY